MILEFVYIFNLADTGICVRYLGGSGGVEILVLLPALAGVPLHHHAAGLPTTLADEDDLFLRSICSTLEKIMSFENIFNSVSDPDWIRIQKTFSCALFAPLWKKL